MKYEVKIYKPSGKFYMIDEPIIAEDYCLYTAMPEIIETKYKRKLEKGWLILVENEGSGSHIYKRN